jgi:superfamily II DNA or RNA helicase
MNNSDILRNLRKLGLTLQPHQEEARADAERQVQDGSQLRLCLYHATGKGKTIASLVCLAQAGVQRVLVLAPPITHPGWISWGEKLGIEVTPISHAKFRQKTYKVRRDQAIIVDEFHLLGGHTGTGWKKLDAMAKGLQAPLIICSATPNYNDVERVYCVMHVLAPDSVKGGYLQFLYRNCETVENAYGREPKVTGLLHHKDAEEFLASLPYVHYVEDEVIKQVTIGDIPAQAGDVPDVLEELGYIPRHHRIIASQMEERHSLVEHRITTPNGTVWPQLYDQIAELVGQASTPVLIYCNHATVAEALARTIEEHGEDPILITGKTVPRQKKRLTELFLTGLYPALIGTASLATGFDGLDKMCDVLLIVDDTDDDALRRQLMGRILPRGLDTDVSKKQVWRLTYS